MTRQPGDVMETSDDLPSTAGSIIEEWGGDHSGRAATLVPTSWDPRTHTFGGLVWCTPQPTWDLESYEVLTVPTNALLRRGTIAFTAGPPRPSGTRPLRRPGTIALLDGTVYTYCAWHLESAHPEHFVWLNPAAGILTEGDIERHGAELVAGMP
ncbi:hypothetical protein ACX8Z9_08170 [Arthrobacter halodurans]|uniref:Uncharacterized protein n=1 Tax=Arthrobacter halodurans TaxID=516699 RepID=A0ABV4UJL9_9MICC